MRLTHIKLAGFKSFVDPTTIPVPGQLVGIVGPNGCGKSNVIDAVRWVLGESSARHLRGESMQDVIFAGSTTRKAVSRASVELVFDNSLGRAAGQWSQYAEIAVKRVLQRDGNSTYYINNVVVRRRDVTDIFLGTGVGARAYAIIEQGMISRIIEARPEELRVFLEEAAGISKYKDRRKETESRLQDTRENLLRVEDIRQELDKQLIKLEDQARVAAEYHALQGTMQTTQHMLWLVKRREATNLRLKHGREIDRLSNELEAKLALLRETEAKLEEVRTRHYSVGDGLHTLQGALYAASAEVARLEQQIKFQHESRARIEQQLQGYRQRKEQLLRQREEAAAQRASASDDLARLQSAVAKAREQAQMLREEQPEHDAQHQDVQTRAAEIQRRLHQAEQGREVEQTHRTHSLKVLNQLQLRTERLQQELAGLPAIDYETVEGLREEAVELDQTLIETRALAEEIQGALAEKEEAWREADRAVQLAQQEIAKLEARLQALEQVQQHTEDESALDQWLEAAGIGSYSRLWEHLQVADGWEAALESVLRDRVHAIVLGETASVGEYLFTPPPVALTVVSSAARTQTPDPDTAEAASPLRPFLELVQWRSGALPGMVSDLLRNVYVAREPQANEFALQNALPEGGWCATREGHVFGRDWVAFHAERSATQGTLARHKEIEALREALANRQATLPEGIRERDDIAEQGKRLRSEQNALQQRLASVQQRQHQLQIDLMKQTQAIERSEQRGAQLRAELEELSEQIELEAEQQAAAEARQGEYEMEREMLHEQLEEVRSELLQAQSRIEAIRVRVAEAEREVHRLEYEEKICVSRISDLENTVKSSHEELAHLEDRLETLAAEQAENSGDPLEAQLQHALALREEHERALANARDELAGVAQQLNELDRTRLATEQQLQPLRDQIGDLRLKEQEARLIEEQFDGHLKESEVDEGRLEGQLPPSARPAALQAQIVQLQGQIEALGAVNLAALEELKAGQERKAYLDSQAADLNEAIETLEGAIRKIDRETRERLQATFDTVNGHLGRMFPALFGGGQAQLLLTGDEILDAGVQVVAQPPGKKNSTIHLLSGGEKALTALSLVFSLFQLNPAPFCLLDEVDAPLDDTNTGRFCDLVRKMSEQTQFLFISHNKIAMEMAQQLIGVTMQESGVSRVVAVDIEEAVRLTEEVAV